MANGFSAFVTTGEGPVTRHELTEEPLLRG